MNRRASLPVSEIFLEANFAAVQELQVARRQVAVFSHGRPGRTTPSEDAAACFQVTDTSGVLVVADGVGGHQSGHVAAAQVIGCIRRRLQRNQGVSLRGTLLDAIEAANHAVMRRGIGSATTLAMMELQKDVVRPYHVGDSMITLISQRGRIKWQTVGHAPVGYAVEAGVLDEEEAMLHPDRHIVSNVIGQKDMSISLGPALKMAARDTAILCSDGLSDNVSTEEMAGLLRTGPLREACEKVVQLAQSRMAQADDCSGLPGKPDDLTIIACRVGSVASAAVEQPEPAPPPKTAEPPQLPPPRPPNT